MIIFVPILFAYLIGSIPFGYIIVFMRLGKDVRNLGSGSMGASNTARLVGLWGGVATLIGDTAKGLLAVMIAQTMSHDPLIHLTSMIAVVTGHIWPVYLKFKGGKGLAVTLGVALAFDYRIAIAYFLVASIVMAVLRNIQAVAIVAAVFLPVIVLLLDHSNLIVLSFAVIAAMILYAHRSNIVELMP